MGDASSSKSSPAVKVAIITTVGVVVAALIGILPSMIGGDDSARKEQAGPWSSIFELQGQIGTITDKVGNLSLGQAATNSLTR